MINYHYLLQRCEFGRLDNPQLTSGGTYYFKSKWREVALLTTTR